MRVIYLHQYFNTHQQSGGTRSFEMARRLVRDGHSVVMITSDREGTRSSNSIEEGIEVIWIKVPYKNAMSFGARVWSFFKFAVLATIAALKQQGDIVFATSTPLTICLPSVLVSKCKRIPMVFEVRDLWPEMPIAVGALRNPVLIWLATLLERFAYRNSSRIISLSPGMTEGVAATGYRRELITCVPNGSDIDFFESGRSKRDQMRTRYGYESRDFLIVYTGTLGVLNGVGYLVRVAKHLLPENSLIKFLVVGDGAEFEKIRRLAEDQKVLGINFQLTGRLAKSEMPAIYAASDMALSLFLDIEAMWKNSANKFFDGIAAGRPIAVNHKGWIWDLIATRDLGLYLPPNDTSEAARRLVEASKNPVWLKQAADSARNLALTEFARDRLYDRFQGVLVDALSESSAVAKVKA